LKNTYYTNIIKNTILIGWFVLFFINFIFQLGILNLFLYGVGLTVLLYYCSTEVITSLKVKPGFAIVFCLVAVSSFLAMIYNQNLSLASYVILFGYFGIALLMVKTKINLKAAYIPYIFNLLYLTYFYITHRTFLGAFGTTSVNYVSVLLIYSFIIIYASKIQNEIKKVSLIPILIAIIYCVFAGGRGGVLSMLLLFVLIVFNKLKQTGKSNTIRNIFIVIGSLIGGVGLLVASSSVPNLMGSGFAERGMDSNGRLLVWGIWLATSFQSLQGILFGANVVSNIPEVFPHLHNSYLMFYADFGLLALISLLFLYGHIFQVFRRVDKNMMSLFLVFLFRSFTDVLWSNFCGDVFVCYFILLTFINDRKIIMSNKYSNLLAQNIRKRKMRNILYVR